MSELPADPVLEAALERLRERLSRTPALETLVAPWLKSHRSRLRHAGFVPIFTLPRWVQEALSGRVDATWDDELTYSTLCGYLFIRLTDDIVDEQNDAARRAALALGVFDYEFQRPYREFFDVDYDFWQRFERDWAWSLDMTAEDLTVRITDREHFERVAAGKLGAIRIPVTAACHLAGRDDAVGPWLELCDAISRLYQFADDLTDWQADFAAGRNSWLLSEAEVRRDPGETLSAWMIRSGYDWARQRLDEGEEQANAAAQAVGSVVAQAHVREFKQGLIRKLEELRPALSRLAALASALDSA